MAFFITSKVTSPRLNKNGRNCLIARRMSSLAADDTTTAPLLIHQTRRVRTAGNMDLPDVGENISYGTYYRSVYE